MDIVTESLLAYIGAEMSAPTSRFPTAGMVFWHPLRVWSDKAATGQAMTYVGSSETAVLPVASTYKGIPCCMFNAGSLWRATTNVKNQQKAYTGTLSCWVACKESLTTSYVISQIAVVRDSNTGLYYYGVFKASQARLRAGKRSSATYLAYNSMPNDTKWHHVVVMLDCAAGWTHTSWKDIVYVDGTKVRESTDSVPNYALTRTFIGNSNESTTNGIYLAGVRLYNRLLIDDEIAALYAEYTPTT